MVVVPAAILEVSYLLLPWRLKTKVIGHFWSMVVRAEFNPIAQGGRVVKTIDQAVLVKRTN